MIKFIIGKWDLFLNKRPVLKGFLEKHGSFLFNSYLFLNIFGWICWQSYKKFQTQSLDFIEISFIINNLVLIIMILIRNKHKLFDHNFFHQLIALFAFYSGSVFIGQPESNNVGLLTVSKGLIFTANILGVITLLNLGKSFGILIALRKVKTGGLYSIVRHPMYGTDILLRIGFIISHFNVFTCVLFVLSTAAYIYRAILEEKLLCREPEYSEYMKKVKYRFIPYVF